MSWEGIRDGIIHIDHILPISFFDITTEEGQHQAFNYLNTQPLWKEDNLKKGDKVSSGCDIYEYDYKNGIPSKNNWNNIDINN